MMWHHPAVAVVVGAGILCACFAQDTHATKQQDPLQQVSKNSSPLSLLV